MSNADIINKLESVGGPAFPQAIDVDDTSVHYAGLNVRDWFAAQALAGLIAYPGREGENNEPKHFARWAYALADAMLEARSAP